MNEEPTTQELLKAIQANQKSSEDILEAINVFANETQEHFEKIEGRLDSVESDVANIKETMVTQAVFQRALDSVEDRLTNEIKGPLFSSQEVQELFA